MATTQERRTLLAITCPYCYAGPHQLCAVRGRDPEAGKRSRRVPVTTLDGGCHDARWQAALGRPAPVVGERVAELRHPAGAVTAAAGERPW